MANLGLSTAGCWEVESAGVSVACRRARRRAADRARSPRPPVRATRWSASRTYFQVYTLPSRTCKNTHNTIHVKTELVLQPPDMILSYIVAWVTSCQRMGVGRFDVAAPRPRYESLNDVTEHYGRSHLTLRYIPKV